MGVFRALCGCRGVVGLNACCSGLRSGDGGFTLVCISGCRGVIGFNVATSQLPVREKVRPARSDGGCEREKVRPAYEKWPKIGGLWRAWRVFSRKHRWRGSVGRVFSRVEWGRGRAGRVFSRKCRWKPRAGRSFSRNSRGTERAGRVLSHHHSGTPAAGRPSSQIEQGTDSLRPPRADGHEKSTPEGVLRRNAEPPPVDRTEGGRCAPGGTRTPNLLNRNQMLYPLSYGRLPFGWV